MTRRTEPWPAGTPCWADLATPDLAAARAFYAELLSWSYTESGEEFGGYLIAETGGAITAGLGTAWEGTPIAWTLMFAVDDVHATAATIPTVGGTVVAPPMQVGSMGSMLLGADPSGARFGVWQPDQMIGVGVVGEPGALSWSDLRSTDPDSARAFYAAVLGQRFEPMPMAGPDYSTVHVGDGDPVAGIGGMMGMDGFPSHWIVYFGVPDVDAAIATTERLGGHVLSPGFDTPYGRMGAVTDPYGASFWVVQMPAESTSG
jgi:predicted enzyme related to lactoylglutathione lyase